MNLFPKQNQTHRQENKLMVTKEETWWGGINQELGKIIHMVTIYTYIYI